MRAGLDTLGIDSKDYAGHSFRIGAVTTVAERSGVIVNQDVGSMGKLCLSNLHKTPPPPREVLAGISEHLSHCPPK